MKKILTLSLIMASIASFIVPAQASAMVYGFDAGRIIDDSVFTNKGTMSAGQIQQFLQSKTPSCDTNGSKIYSGSTTRAQYAASKGVSTPFTCLKDYNEGGRTAAQIIYDVSQKYSINPQVLIVLLQKEQGLITDDWPWPIQYRSATGYGCPDTAACDSQYYGLTNQLDWAAKMFRAIMNNSPTWYTPYILGNNYIRYSPDASCGGSTVYIQDRATQALYNYTPYQPNSGALAADWGTANCGAYGNRNFYLYFTSWFGSTSSSPVRTWEWAGQQVKYGSTVVESNVVNLQPGGSANVIIKARNTGNQTWYRFNTLIGTSRPYDRTSEFYSSSWLGDTRPAIMKEDAVMPGEVGTFEFTLTAPNKVFNTREYFNIVTEGISWQNDIGYYYDINVNPPAGEYYNTNILSHGLYSDPSRTTNISDSYNNVIAGSTIYGKINLKNTGNNPFTPSNTFLATTGPRDRTSPFMDSSWLSTNRIAAVPGSVASGASSTINYTLKAPTQAGTYQEKFGMVVEGKSWIDYDKAAYTINVMSPPRTVLTSGQQIIQNDQLMNDRLRHNLILQPDGNLVLYRNGTALWSSGTVGAASPALVLQPDGNLVLYASGGRAVWNSGTVSGQYSAFVLQNDGNVVLYGAGNVPRWSTGTNGR